MTKGGEAEMRSALEVMQTHQTPHPELNLVSPTSTQQITEEEHRDYQLCSDQSKTLLHCVMNHPGHVDECDKEYGELRKCQQRLKH